MKVIKRDGRLEPMMFDKITTRIQKLCYGLQKDKITGIDPVCITFEVMRGIYPNITTVELDTLAAEISASKITKHYNYSILAARIAVSNLHKETSKSFSDTISKFFDRDMFDLSIYNIIMRNKDVLNSSIVYSRDYDYHYFGFKTLQTSYLWRIDGKVVERPQHMLMRVAISIHREDIQSAIETYEMMSKGFFTHATPTLFNSGNMNPQLSSCFLLQMKDDSVEGIFDTLKDCAQISKWSGGIGLNIHNVRGKGSHIKGTNGKSGGIVPMLRMFNNCSRFINQGGKRNGSIAIYLEPWHCDVEDFLSLKKNTGKEEMRARDLFYALWVPDLFMKRFQQNEMWSLMCPGECPGLSDCWGDEFEKLYQQYESEGRYKKQINARSLMEKIIESQIETGTPYILYKDACNKKNNQSNLGTLKSSNLCTEIMEYSSSSCISVCNLASIALPKFVVKPLKRGQVFQINESEKHFSFQKLREMVHIIVKNLNKIIDLNYYPIPETKQSNLTHRPIGIGVQGLADTFTLLRIPYESSEAKMLNKQIFEVIYHAALEASCELSEKTQPYDSYHGSPLSKGVFQFDLWGVIPIFCDWKILKKNIEKNGVKNSLFVSLMPTASTAQIMNNSESFEPRTNNIYTRGVLSGDFQVVNEYLIKDLINLGLWNEEMKQTIIRHKGSIQEIGLIPLDLKDLYKTVWEMSQKTLIDMSADRAAFIDQSQSLNIYMSDPSVKKIRNMHFYGWKKGLKTGCYYLRTKAAASPIQFTVKNEVSDCISCSS